jgi:hypothetical protein
MTWSRRILVAGTSAVWLAALGCQERGGGEQRAGGTGGSASGAQASRQGGATATGQVVSAKEDELVLRQQGDPKELKLKVDSSTRVLIDGKQASVKELREGTQVRASFDAGQGEPKATRIEAIGGGAATGGGTGSSDPGSRPGGSAGTTGGLGGSSSATPGQSGGPGGESSTSASEPGAPRGDSGSTTR